MGKIENMLTKVEINEYYGTAEKEAQDTACRESGGVPQLQISPKAGAYRGLIETISAFSPFSSGLYPSYMYLDIIATH